MWRRRGSIGGGSAAAPESASMSTSTSLTGFPGISRSGGGFFGSDPRASDRALVFSVEVPTPGPLGLDLRARHVERDKPQRGAVVKGFRPLAGGRRGFVEESGRVKVGDILQIIHRTTIDEMPFELIVKHAMQLQQDPTAWPLRLEFRRDQGGSNDGDDNKPRRSSFFRSSVTNPAQDRTFNEKLQYFRGFFANKIPTGGAAPKIKEKPPMPSLETVNEMYRDLLVKRGVPDDVMDELVRIEPLDNKWHVVWYAQQHDNEEMGQSNLAEAAKLAENLVELKWDNKGLKDLDALRNKIATGSAEWTEAFMDNFGLDYLTMKLPDPSPFPIEHSKFEKATRVCEVVLRILRSITHFSAGVEAITNVPGLVKRVTLCFHTDNGDLKKHTLQLLGIICYNSAAGHESVVEAFTHYKEVKGETIRFSCLRDALKSTRYSLSFKEDVLSFVNIIVNKAIRLEDRLAIRADFIALKMAGYFEEIRAKSQAVQRQKLPASPAECSIENDHLRKDTTGSRDSITTAAGALSAAVKAQLDTSFRTATITLSPEWRTARSQPQGGSKSAPSSPRERSASDFDRLSFSSSRPSIPSITDDGGIIGGSGKKIISSSTTQLRNQLDNMEKQIEVFERFMEDDRKDTIYDNTDLASLESVFKTLSDNVAQDADLQGCLLSILQQLLFIPGDRVIGKEMWGLCERLMKQVGLLSPVDEVRTYEMGYDDRKAVLRLRDRYTQFLQKCADDDPTFSFTLGPIILIENRKAGSQDDFLSDDTSDETDDEDSPETVSAKDHPELAKYFKLLRMGMPLDHVRLKLKSELGSTFSDDILENPTKQVPIAKPDDGSADGTQGIRAAEHEMYTKYFKLKSMGMPPHQVQLKMKAEGLDDSLLDTPDVLLSSDGTILKESESSEVVRIKASEHEQYSKFFKLLKLGMPLEHVKLKVSSEGLDPSILDTPDILLDERGFPLVVEREGIPVQEHEKFAKYFKLVKMGMPVEQVKLKASAEGVDAALLDKPDTLLNKDGTLFATEIMPKSVGIPAKEHDKFAKFFKLLKMGMPIEQVKLKASSEGIDPGILDTPDVLIDINGNPVLSPQPGVAVKDHVKYAKFFKLIKMGMPLEHIKMKVSSEGLDPSKLDSPDKLLDADGNELVNSPKGVRVSDHEKYIKFFKLLKMGMPLEHVKLKVSAEGLDSSLLETPNVLVAEDGSILQSTSNQSPGMKVCDHPAYAKYFKLLKMGMPRHQLDLKMHTEGLDSKLLDNPDTMIPETLGSATPTAPPLPPAPPKPKLRNLYWDTVKDDAMGGTIWEEFEQTEHHEDSSTPTPRSNAPTNANFLDEYVNRLSSIFVNKPVKAKDTTDTKKVVSKRRAPARVALIDVKRANNIGIMLARFRLPYWKIRNAVLQVDKEILSIEKVSALIQFAPEETELEAVRSYQGDPKLLGDAEQYFRAMLSVPRLTTRLQAIHATWQFDAYVEEQRRLMDAVRNACMELKQCGRLREIFRVVLSLGNALNHGTARGGAKGFRLSILLKLNQVKASDNSMTLLNYVAQVLRAKNPDILAFDEDLPSVENASRVTMQVLKAGEAAVRKAATLICDELEEHSKLGGSKPTMASDVSSDPYDEVADLFQDAIRPFAERARLTSEQIQVQLDEMMKSFEGTLLQTADRDNERKRIAEERRVRREEETKKRLEMLKNKKKKTSFASLKDGDVDDIVMKIRAKRVAEKRQELLETPIGAEGDRIRSTSRSSNTQAPRSGSLVGVGESRASGTVTASGDEIPIAAVEVV